MSRETFVTTMTVEPCSLGDTFSKLPPHVTLCPPFRADPNDLARYHDRMRDVMEENPGGLRVRGVEPDNFGDSGEVPVLRLNLSPLNDFAIHAGAYVGAQEIAHVDGRYAGLDWSPHISLTPAITAIETGLTLRQAQLFHYQGNTKQVIAVYAAGWARILEADQWKK